MWDFQLRNMEYNVNIMIIFESWIVNYDSGNMCVMEPSRTIDVIKEM